MIQEKTLLAAKMRHYQSMMCVSTYMYMLVGRRGGGVPHRKNGFCPHIHPGVVRLLLHKYSKLLHLEQKLQDKAASLLFLRSFDRGS